MGFADPLFAWTDFLGMFKGRRARRQDYEPYQPPEWREDEERETDLRFAQNQLLFEGLDRLEEPRSIAARLNLLFDVVRKGNGEPYTNEEIAALGQGYLTTEKLQGLRDRTATGTTERELFAISDAFGVDFGYWHEVQARPEELDPEIREARGHREASRYLPGTTALIARDLRAFMDEKGWTPADVQKETGGAVHAGYLEALLDGRTSMRDLEKLQTLAAMMDLPLGVWRERYFGRWFMHDLVP